MAATTLLSDNGVTSGITGYTLTGGNDGTLQLQTTTAGGTATTAMTLDASQNTTVAGNLTLSGTAKRITGDFSNATVANRAMFQSSTTNGQTVVMAIPNGTSSIAAFEANTDSTGGTNGSVGQLNALSTDIRISSGQRGTGTYLPMTFYTGGLERMRVDTSGNVGIGTDSPTSGVKLDVNGTIKIGTGTSSSAGCIFSNANYGMLFQALQAIPAQADFSWLNSAGTERARINSSGNLLMGDTAAVLTTARATFKASSGAGVVSAVSSNTNLFCINTNNTSWDAVSFRYNTSTEVGRIACTSTATSYVTSSDYRLKENQQPMVGALSIVQQLKPCTYTWKSTGQEGQGFIAHELQAVVPDCVVGEKDAVETYTDEEGNEQTRPVYQGIDTSFLVATLTAAIQEQQALITTLTERITALEAK